MKSPVRLSTWILSRSDLPGVRATLTGPRGLRASARPPSMLGALSRVQHRLAQPYPGGRDLDALVLPQELQGLIERELAVGHEPHKDIRGGGAHVGEVLLLARIDVEVIGARVLAHDH